MDEAEKARGDRAGTPRRMTEPQDLPQGLMEPSLRSTQERTMNFDEPSMELDESVAKAIGWTKHEHPPMPLLGTDRHWKRPDGSRVKRWHTQSNYGEDQCWPFSTDWSAAMTAAKAYLADAILSRRKRFAAALRDAVTPSSIAKSGTVSWEVLFELLVATGPLALCAAILETPKGKSDADETD